MDKRAAIRAVEALQAAGHTGATLSSRRVPNLESEGDRLAWGVADGEGGGVYTSVADMPEAWQAEIRRAESTIDLGREHGIEKQAQDRSMAVVDTGCATPKPLLAARDAAFIARQVRLVREGAAAERADLQRAYDGLAELLDGILDGAKNRQLKTVEQAAGRLERAHDVARQMAAVHAAIMEAPRPADSMPERTEADAWSDILLGYNVPEEGERIEAWRFIDIILRLRALQQAMTHHPTTVISYVEATIALLEGALGAGVKPEHPVTAPRRLVWGELS